jgi:hypothetical protein
MAAHGAQNSNKNRIGRRDAALDVKTPKKQGLAPRFAIGRKIGTNGGMMLVNLL